MKFNYKKTFILGFGMLSIMMCTTLYETFVPIFLHKYIDKAWLIGFLMTIDNYLSLFIQPLIGRVSDKTRTRYGRRLPFMLIGMPLAAIMVCLIPVPRSFTSLILVIVLFNLVMASFRSPTVSLMPDITPPKFRSKANGAINFMGGLGAAAALFLGSRLYDINPAFPFYMAGAVILISITILYLNINERRDAVVYPAPVSAEDERKLSKIRTLPELISAVKKWKNVLFMLMAVFFLYVAFNSVSSFFTLFAQELLGVPESEAAGKFFILAALMVLFSIPAGFIGTKLGKKRTLVIGISAMALTFACIAATENINLIGWLFVPAGIAWALVMINTYPFIVSIADAGNIGTYTGLYYLFSSLAAICSPPVIGMLIDKVGYGVLFKYSVAAFIAALLCILLVKAPNADAPTATPQP